MDNAVFEKAAAPVIDLSLKRAIKLADDYYYSKEYMAGVTSKPRPDYIKSQREAAREQILALNKLADSLHPKIKGLPTVQIPNAFHITTEQIEQLCIIRSTKDILIKHMCRAYGLEPPKDERFTDGESMRNLIVYLVSELLKTPLKARPIGRVERSKMKLDYDKNREVIFAECVDQIKSTLKVKASDQAIVKAIINGAKEQTPFGKNCLRFQKFYIRVKGDAYTIASIKNRLSATRRDLKAEG